MGFLWVLGGNGKESMCIYIEREVCGRLGLKVLRRRMKRRAIDRTYRCTLVVTEVSSSGAGSGARRK